MLLLPPELREAILAYIQTNPSPNIPVIDALRIVAALRALKIAEDPSVVTLGSEAKGA